MEGLKVGLVGAVIAAALAGCLGVDNDVGFSGAVADDEAPFALDISMTGCREGGGVSLYNMADLPVRFPDTPPGVPDFNGRGNQGPTKDFTLADVQPDVGYPVVASYGAPIPPGGETTGIWHISVNCDSYSYEGEERGPLEWGWVAMKIERPEWDADGPERQYFVADLSFGDADVVADLRAATNVHASETWNGKIEWLAPMVMHTVLDDEEHGVFETHAKMKDYRAFEAEPIRFWMMVAEGHESHGEARDPEGTTYRAISFDLWNKGGERHFVAEGTAFLSHTRTQAHGAVPGAAGNLAGLLYTGFDRHITMGPSPDLEFEETWKH